MTELADFKTQPDATSSDKVAAPDKLASSENCFTYGSFVLVVDRLLEVTFWQSVAEILYTAVPHMTFVFKMGCCEEA